MENKKKFIFIIIFFLIIILLLLFLLLFVPVDEDNEAYSLIDYIDVETNIKDEEVKTSLNIEEISVELSNIENPATYVPNNPIFVSEEEYVEPIGHFEPYDSSKSGPPIIENENLFIERNDVNGKSYGISEEEVEKYIDINYYTEDCLHLISKNIDSTNLKIEERDIPLEDGINCYGAEGYYRIFKVYNTETMTQEDDIAIDLVTGDMYGYTPEEIFYDYDFYELNPDYMKNVEEMFKDGVTVQAYDTFKLWERVELFFGQERYGKARITHIKYNNNHYYKVYWDDTEDYVLFDYYTGEMFQVVNGVKSSNITLEFPKIIH